MKWVGMGGDRYEPWNLCETLSMKVIIQHLVKVCNYISLCFISGEAATAGDKHGGEAEQERKWTAPGCRSADSPAWRTRVTENWTSAAHER